MKPLMVIIGWLSVLLVGMCACEPAPLTHLNGSLAAGWEIISLPKELTYSPRLVTNGAKNALLLGCYATDMSQPYLVRSTDNGQSWNAFPAKPTLSGFRSAQFITDRLVVADGTRADNEQSGFFKSTDGGQSWTVLNTPTEPQLFGYYYLDAQRAAAVGFNGFQRTNDGGYTFRPIPDAPTGDYRQLLFVDGQTGYAYAGDLIGEIQLIPYSALARTTDGGNSWSEVFKTNKVCFVTVSFPDRQTGFVGTYDGQLWQTADSGVTFRLVSAKLPQIPVKIIFRTAQVGYLLSEKGVFTTTDGGKTWQSSLTVTATSLTDMALTDGFLLVSTRDPIFYRKHL